MKTTQNTKQKAFAENLRWTCERMEFGNYEKAAKELNVGYAWLRRAVTKGCAWTISSNNAIENLAKYFGVPKEMLWDESGQFRLVVLKKSKPDYLTHCLALEKVLRHYWKERPPLLDRCLKIINTYNTYIDKIILNDPYWMFHIIEKADLTGEEKFSSREQAIREQHLREAFEKKLIQMRLLPKKEILEQVVRERIATLERQSRLIEMHSILAWEMGGAKKEVVKMLEWIFSAALQNDGETLSDDKKKELTAVAESFAKKLWDGEYRANV